MFKNYCFSIIYYIFAENNNFKSVFIMLEWWSALSVAMKVLWAITLSASLIFVIQTIMTFLGADTDHVDFDTDMHVHVDDPASFDGHTGMNLYTFRNFVNFFLGFGWTAILLRDDISSTAVLLLVATLVGVGLVAIVMYMFKLLYSMQSSGNIDVYQHAVGCLGRVYLTIPENRRGLGKVQITIKNAVREYEAVTDEDEPLKTGDAIKVVEVLNQSTLLVEKLNSLII